MKHLYIILLILPLIGFGQNKIGKLNMYVDGGTFLVINSVFINVERHLTSSKSNKLHLSYELLEIIRPQRETNWNCEGYVNLYVNLFS